MSDLQELQHQLGYRFNEIGLLQEALTHRSAAARHNERLEFLGDSVLNFVIAQEIFRRRPQDSEGSLSRLRASLVNRSTLAEIARGLNLGSHLRLGGGELKSGGHRRDSILADTLEAVIGAAYLDSDFYSVAAMVVALYRERLDSLPDEGLLKDPKTRLQEKLQSTRRPLPEYQVLDVSGRAHHQMFRVECRLVDSEQRSVGEAGSRRQAEQQAAATMLGVLGGEEA
ncbi:ribonuclease III [Halorhodospira halochloris]|uniref:Ribonuclease 3 n=1 Tax=Halorhodospira halochloris TaxID=1052 RepID=A0A0X8XA61_HALHR|nr:ribonuclease III [Halorhodospira halochloris]MBK1652014.1 ribonuclease III [Halorhodospira halochloris]MCG5547888.1 ribonuclease III [Halorhodospira halochloris]BAU58312.1 ribonuclease III [Halorhodospira halochloris]